MLVFQRRDAEFLRRFLEGEGVWHLFHKFPEHTATVEAAARQLGTSPERVIKTLVVVSEGGEPLIAIIPGDKKLDLSKLSAVVGGGVRMAKAREVERFTGYSVGALPPVGHGLRTYVDKGVLKYERVVGGGGSTHTLIELRSEDLVKLTKAVISDITE
jgi:Cys-tRNA(Pro) deacylase